MPGCSRARPPGCLPAGVVPAWEGTGASGVEASSEGRWSSRWRVNVDRGCTGPGVAGPWCGADWGQVSRAQQERWAQQICKHSIELRCMSGTYCEAHLLSVCLITIVFRPWGDTVPAKCPYEWGDWSRPNHWVKLTAPQTNSVSRDFLPKVFSHQQICGDWVWAPEREYCEP